MTTPDQHPHLAWHSNGQSTLSGPLLGLYQHLDRLFLSLAATFGCEELQFPVFIAAAELHKLDYFRNFPHLLTVAATLEATEQNLSAFADGMRVAADGCLQMTRLAPIHSVLTPAACYHCYIHFQGSRLERPLLLTTRCACFRRETHYLPLRRQWHFSMRELVCIGTAAEVKDFLAAGRTMVDALSARLDLPLTWIDATDPFFKPASNPRQLLQILDPVKQEMQYGGELALGSINFHRNYFGSTFAITREGKEAYSGCIAFGLERWIYAILDRHGHDPKAWPDLEVRS